jgi:hypothetical protein
MRFTLNERWMVSNPAGLGWLAEYYSATGWTSLPFLYETQAEAEEEAKAAARRHL